MDRPYFVKLFLKSLNLNKRFSEIIRSTGGFAVIEASDSQRPELIVFEFENDTAKDLSLIQSLITGREADEVFLVSEEANTQLLLQAMRLGVKEFFPQPIDPAEVAQALQRFKKRKQEASIRGREKSGQVISVFGSKGGVGTTTIAVNLAVSLMHGQAKKATVLLDMNTLFGEIPLFLEIAPKFHWGEITKNVERLDDTFLQHVLTRHKTGVQVLPSPAYLNGHVRPTPDVMARILALMKRMFDYIVIDAGQSTDDTSMKVIEISDTLMLVTILSLPCLANTNKLLRSLTDLGYVQRERIRVVLNRYMKKNDISISDAEAGIGQELYWTIPNDYGSTMAAINNGKPLSEVAPKADITRSFLELAKTISAPESGPGHKN